MTTRAAQAAEMAGVFHDFVGVLQKAPLKPTFAGWSAKRDNYSSCYAHFGAGPAQLDCITTAIQSKIVRSPPDIITTDAAIKIADADLHGALINIAQRENLSLIQRNTAMLLRRPNVRDG